MYVDSNIALQQDVAEMLESQAAVIRNDILGDLISIKDEEFNEMVKKLKEEQEGMTNRQAALTIACDRMATAMSNSLAYSEQIANLCMDKLVLPMQDSIYKDEREQAFKDSEL